MFALCARLGLSARPASVEEAKTLLAREGFAADPAAGFCDSPEPGGAPLIELGDVRFSYGAANPALRGVSLAIRRGDFVALLGPNGSGKTTLVKHLNGLLAPEAGRVLFGGVPVAGIGTARMGSKVGFVFQNPDHMLFEATAFDEVAFGPRNRGVSGNRLERNVREALETVGLADRLQSDPFVMTKGDRQKLAVACVLACEPDVLILDEPTTGLDAIEQNAMMQLLRRLNLEGRTIIIVTHALDAAAAYARRAVLMNEGRIVADGPTRSVFHDASLLSRADLASPPCVALGGLLGIPALTVEELAGAIRKGAP